MERIGTVLLRLGAGKRRAHLLGKSWRQLSVRRSSSNEVPRSSSNEGLSALHVSDADSKHTAPVDLNLDLSTRLINQTRLKENLKLRGLQVDVDKLANTHRRLVQLTLEREKLEEEREHVALLMAEIKKAQNPEHEKSKDILISQGKNIREKLKEVMREWWSVEEEVAKAGLSLPNDLHATTPHEDVKILKQSFTEKECGASASHIEIAKKFGLIKFSNVGPRSYFLQSDLALLEQQLCDWMAGTLTDAGFLQIACPEVVRTAIVEGCGLDAGDAKQVYTLQQRVSEKEADTLMQWMDRLHLRGPTIFSFAAYLAKMSVDPQSLPLKLFCVGRQYSPESALPGLFGARQTTKVHALVGCADEAGSEVEFTRQTEGLWQLYQNTGLPLRLVLLPAACLMPAESLRAELQLWSPSLQRHVPVGSVSLCSDFISRRLMIYQSANEDVKKDTPLLHMVLGESMDTASLLAVLLEHGTITDKGYQLPALDFLPNFTRKAFGERPS